VRDDEHLVQAAVAGDRDALGRLVELTRDDVWRYCSFLGRGDEVGDLVQETYARALRALPRFEGRSSIRTWLLAIARRVCADAVRAARKRRALDAHRFERGAAPDHAPHVETELLLARLEPERREAFVLTQLVGVSYADAAEVCGVPIGTIRSRVARARVDLQAALVAETG
jgi:RNA polymerase sigma-70 factor (ECF subfamily)